MEVWKDIKDFEGLYQISNLGRIKSIKSNRNLKQSVDSCGYYSVGLTNKKTKIFRVHLIMAITFLNHIPCGHKLVIDHIDNNKLNNKLENLQLITQRENTTKDKKNKNKLGVSFYKNKYYVRIYYIDKNEYLGRYDNEDEAHLVYMKASEDIRLNKYIKKEVIHKTSNYKGVSLHKPNGKWIANFRNKHVGYYNTEIEAYNAYLETKTKYYHEMQNL